MKPFVAAYFFDFGFFRPKPEGGCTDA